MIGASGPEYGAEPAPANIAHGALYRAKWEVLWIKNGKIQRKDCGDDLTEAIRIYGVVKGNRKGATLRCKNFGFPPPDKFRPTEVVIKHKRYLKIPMKQLNAKGIWWCPYCRELRRFKLSRSFQVGGVTVRDVRHICPMCGISHRDIHVRRWNPVATRLFYELEEAPRRRANRTKESRKKAFKKKRRRKT